MSNYFTFISYDAVYSLHLPKLHTVVTVQLFNVDSSSERCIKSEAEMASRVLCLSTILLAESDAHRGHERRPCELIQCLCNVTRQRRTASLKANLPSSSFVFSCSALFYQSLPSPILVRRTRRGSSCQRITDGLSPKGRLVSSSNRMKSGRGLPLIKDENP